MDEEKVNLFVAVELRRAQNGTIEVCFTSGGEGYIAGLDSEGLGRALTDFMLEMGSLWMKEHGATPTDNPAHPEQPTVQ